MSNVRTYRKEAARILIVILGFVYTSALFVSYIHTYFAHQKVAQEVCSLENEKDPCHRSIYHQDVENGCDHDTHLIVPVVNCEQCLFIVTSHVADHKVYKLKKIENPDISNNPYYSQDFINNPLTDNYLRGPPLYS